MFVRMILPALFVFALTIAGCASPDVVQTRQVADNRLTCDELADSIREAEDFERQARKERGVTGTNVAAAVLFWPALLGTYANTQEAIAAAEDRQDHLSELRERKGCA